MNQPKPGDFIPVDDINQISFPQPKPMFQYLKKYNHIIVTGPQRSGTRIAAQMIAKDTDYTYIDEMDIYGSSIAMLIDKMHKNKHTVAQCPQLSNIAHMWPKDVFIIFMIRKIEDIINSQKRINWGLWEVMEKQNYRHTNLNMSLPIANIKYMYWYSHQKPALVKQGHNNFLELEFETLKNHPMWIDKPQRTNFQWNETK